ncbi:MAG: beta-galactosidase, partial [Victivallales bacterium]
MLRLRYALLFGFSLVQALNSVSLMGSDEINYTLPPASQWELQVRPQDTASLRERDGILSLDYEVKTDAPFQAGHQSFQQSVVKLLLKKPLPLSINDQRILFEAKGIQTSSKQGTLVLLMPLLRDANGELICYKPQSQQHLKNGTSKWCGWKTHSFYSTEAGGAASDSFSTSGGDNNSWPDGDLTFLGFELAVRADKILVAKGCVEFGGFTFAGLKMPDRDPYVYADAMLDKPGKYSVATQIFRRFQDIPVRETARTLDFDPQRASLARQKIVFELGPDDNYWIRYQIASELGEIVVTDQMRAWVEGSPAAAIPVPVNLDSAPSIGYLRINPGHPSCGVYENEKEIDLTLRAFAKNLDGYQILWRLERFSFPETAGKGEEKVNFKDGQAQDIKLRMALPEGCDAFRFIAEVKSAGKIIDCQEYILGRKTDLGRQYANRTGKRITRDEIKQSAYVRMTYLPYKGGKALQFKNRQEAVGRFSDALKRISKITTNVTLSYDTVNFEILPGVFDFELLDMAMDAATDQNCRLTVRLGHADHSGILRWQRYWPQRNSDGTMNQGHRYYGSFSVTDEEFINNLLRGFKALHDRYQIHPAFQGYQIFEIAGEWALLDEPWNGSIVGYENVSRAAFVKYVKKHVSDDLTKLNRRWGTAFASWDQVCQPLPDMKKGARPDIRLYWLDFCSFKNYYDRNYWKQTVSRSIRGYDADSVVIVYNLNPGGFEDSDEFKSIDYIHNGGNHFLRGEGVLVDAWEKNRIGWITEPHMPHRWAAYGDRDNRGWLLDWTTYIMLAQAGAGGANMHIYYWPLNGGEDLSLPAHYGREYAYDRFQRWCPLLEEMHGIKLQQTPPQVAVIQDIYTLFCKHRTVFQPRMDDLRRWFELLKADSIDYQDFRLENRDKYKLVLPNILDEVMSEANIRLIGEMVKGGAKTVITPMTGSLCPERPDLRFALLRELGIKPPENSYLTSAENVSAKVAPGCPFFAAEQPLPFFTLSDLKRETQAKDMAQRFYQWPYRFLPQTDYFGIYPGQHAEGQVMAKFPDGGTALSLHKFGKGEVLVLWGTPDYTKMAGFMQKVADWAAVANTRRD